MTSGMSHESEFVLEVLSADFTGQRGFAFDFLVTEEILFIGEFHQILIVPKDMVGFQP